MKRDEIGSLIRKERVPWVAKLPESRPCLMMLLNRQCARRALWGFTSDHLSHYRGGVYCWSHLMMIVSSGEEQARLEEHLAATSEV